MANVWVHCLLWWLACDTIIIFDPWNAFYAQSFKTTTPFAGTSTVTVTTLPCSVNSNADPPTFAEAAINIASCVRFMYSGEQLLVSCWWLLMENSLSEM